MKNAILKTITDAQKQKEREKYIAEQNYKNALKGQVRLFQKAQQIITSIQTNPQLKPDDRKRSLKELKDKIDAVLQSA